jgi:hypothetical protein
MARWHGTTTERGYGTAHQKERARWQPVVNAGQAWCHAAVCLKASRWIQPGTPWDLGHTADRSAYIGPCHMACNRSEGAVRGNRARGRIRQWIPLRTSRQW